ncbi:hypothetical protein [Streptacidiphilus cavernicola]|uniref:Uncharacterized protein n=1 Tax=Streptacidiphilus cavernicola TaxID=3342716 RepID=A0ABV6W040_9ACTN
MLSDLDQAIIFALTTLKDDAPKLTAALMANELTDKERDHLAKRFAVLADVLNERAELMRKRAAKRRTSDPTSSQVEATETNAG